MTSSSTSTSSGNRRRLCRSDHQPNMLEYIDTTLNDSFLSRLKIENPSSIQNVYDQFGNTIVDQYLLYILCQKLNPTQLDNRIEHIYHSLHKLFLIHGKISKSFFEYSPSTINRSNYQTLFTNYTNFIWNEFDINVLLELACFLFKYRLCDLFQNVNSNRQKIHGFFLEIIAIYYIVTYHHEYFVNSRSKDMLFQYPQMTLTLENHTTIFNKFLRDLHENGEIIFDIRQIRMLLQSDAYQFLNKKLENKKIGFMNFFDTILQFQRENSCRSLKSLCRLTIKMHIKHYPNDIKQFSSLDEQLINYLTYENKYTLESLV